MGKSFKNNKKNYSEKRDRDSANFKYRKNKLKEERVNESYRDYHINGYKQED